jgi:hypothetical protein
MAMERPAQHPSPARRPKPMTRTPAHPPRTGRPAASPPRTPRVSRWPSASHGRWPPPPGRHPAARPSRSARSPASPLPQRGCSRSPGRWSPAQRPPGRPGDPRTRTGLVSPRHPHRFRGSRAAPSRRPAPGAPRPRARRAARGPGGLRPAAAGTLGTGSAHSPRRRAGADGPGASDRTGTPAGSRRRPGQQRLDLIQRQPALGPLQPAEGRLHRRGPVGTPIPVRRHAAGPLVASRRAGSPWTEDGGSPPPRTSVHQLLPLPSVHQRQGLTRSPVSSSHGSGRRAALWPW